MTAVNRHATVVVIGTRGVLIQGPSGSGKTRTALELLARHAWSARLVGDEQVFLRARLVGDDQVFLRAMSGRLVAEVPQAIAGLAELRGFGPIAIAHERRAVIDLVVSLVDTPGPVRFAPDATLEIEGVVLPHLSCRSGVPGDAALAITAFLGHFGHGSRPGTAGAE